MFVSTVNCLLPLFFGLCQLLTEMLHYVHQLVAKCLSAVCAGGVCLVFTRNGCLELGDDLLFCYILTALVFLVTSGSYLLKSSSKNFQKRLKTKKRVNIWFTIVRWLEKNGSKWMLMLFHICKLCAPATVPVERRWFGIVAFTSCFDLPWKQK